MELLFLHLLSQYGYIALFFLVFIGGTYVPVPGGVILVAAGVLSHHHHIFRLIPTFVVAILASLADDALTYGVTRWVGKQEQYLLFVRKNKYAGFIERQFNKRPFVAVAVSRFIGFTSMPVNALAGLTRMPMVLFFAAAAIGDGICIAIYLATGYGIGFAWKHDLRTALHVVEALLAGAVIIYLGFFFITELRKSTSKSIDSM